jgi:hypothetical protein
VSHEKAALEFGEERFLDFGHGWVVEISLRMKDEG